MNDMQCNAPSCILDPQLSMNPGKQEKEFFINIEPPEFIVYLISLEYDISATQGDLRNGHYRALDLESMA